jgi:hypothetical protein
MIGGFVAGPKDRADTTVVVRALGPSLQDFGVKDSLQDPVLELHDQNGTTFATNDDWEFDPNAAKVLAAGLAPSDTRESAIYTTVRPGGTTAIVRGKQNSVGVALVEVYQLR